jgi:spore maturation protein CgeB
MKIYLVHPGYVWGSRPISESAADALRALGCEVVALDLHRWRAVADAAVKGLASAGLGGGYPGLLEQLACERIPLRVIEEEPDLFLAVHGAMVPPHIVAAVRKLGVPTAVWLLDDPHELDLSARYAACYDIVFTNDRSSVQTHRRFGLDPESVHYLPTGCDVELYAPAAEPEPAYASDVLFLGSGFPERVAFLESCEPFLRDRDFRLVGLWTNVPRDSWLRRHVVEGVVPPREAARWYRNAKIVLNLHRDGTGLSSGSNLRAVAAHAPNPRCFEAAACGAFVLSDDRRPGLRECFRVPEEMPVFKTKEELAHLLDHYLARPDERRAVSAAAMRRARTEHSYGRRMDSLLAGLDRVLLKKPLPA